MDGCAAVEKNNPITPPFFFLPDEFKAYFIKYGTVADAQIMVDHATGRSRGFG